MPSIFRGALTCALLPLLAPSLVQDPARSAYEQAQRQRNQARARWSRNDPAEIRAGIELLRETLAWLADPKVRALAKGHDSLRWRAHDVYLDLALAHGKLADADGVLTAIAGIAEQHRTLEPMTHLASWAADRLVEGGVLAGTRYDARVRAAIAALRGLDPFYALRPDSLAAGSGELTEDQRIAGLALLWSEARYNFVWFDRLEGLDWHRSFLDFLPRVRAAADRLAYYRVLQEMCALLRDSHTSVSLPRDLAQKHEAAPPLTTTLAEGRVFVHRIGSARLAGLGLQPGVEIVAVDGKNPREHAEACCGARICASTSQDREQRLLSHQLLRGDVAQPVAIRTRDGKDQQIEVPRGGYTDRVGEPPYAFDVLADNIAHVILRSCEGNDLVTKFEADLPRLLACDALVLDIRDNGGGNSSVGHGFLAALTEVPFLTSRWSTPLYRPAHRAWGRPVEWHTGKPESRQPRAGERFLKPVALLIGPRTFSAAEDLAVAFDAMRRGPLVGEAIGGSTGQPLSFPLPGGGSARVCAKRDTYPDGKAFVGVGVQPTHAVAPKAEDLRAGRDPVLEAALGLLREAVKGR